MNATVLDKKVQISRDFSYEIIFALQGCNALADAADAQIERYRDCWGTTGSDDCGERLTKVSYVLHDLMGKLNAVILKMDTASMKGACHECHD